MEDMIEWSGYRIWAYYVNSPVVGLVAGCWFLVNRYSFLVSRFSLGRGCGGLGFRGLLGLGSFLRILIGGFAEALEFQEGF